MFNQVELISVGLAAVIDTVLLLTLIERRNWPQAVLAVVVFVAGAWMLHAGAFARLLLVDLTGPWAEQVNWLAFLVMSVGLVLVPSAMTHGCWRLWRFGESALTGWSPRYVLAYLPGAILLVLLLQSTDDPRSRYSHVAAPLILAYAIWLTIVNFGSALCFFLARGRWNIPRSREFFTAVAWAQVINGALAALVLFVLMPAWPEYDGPLQLIVLLAPTVLAAMFGYFVIRYNFMQVMVERAVVYGVIIVAAILFHHVAVQGLQERLQDRYRIDFGILEGIVALGLIVAYQPLRQRAGESLRYLLGSRVSETRQQLGELSVELSNLSGHEPREILIWFCQSLERVLGVEYAGAWVFGTASHLLLSAGSAPAMCQATALQAPQFMRTAEQNVWTPWTASRPFAGQLFDVQAALVARFEHAAASGVVLLGRRRGNREFSQEEAGAVGLLVEQLGTILHNSWLQADRLDAERRAWQAEKLSMLGLLASSLAHEIKNPLSSIKTIATVMAEDLGSDHAHRQDLQLILSEVERLANTTAQMLSFARPPAAQSSTTSVTGILESTLAVMRHWARERGVTVECAFEGTPALVAADEAALREVFFNLLQNSIEAAGQGGKVRVTCRRVMNGDNAERIVVEIHDTGPGIAPEVQDRLFQPFVTSKASGTGLGLYLVGRRMRDVGGEVRCQSSPGTGTTFTVELPALPQERHAPV